MKIGKTGHAFLIEKTGMLLSSSAQTEPITFEQGNPIRIKGSEAKNVLISQTSTYLEDHFDGLHNIDRLEQFTFKINEKKHFLQVTPYQHEGGIDWLVVVVIPESDFMEQIHKNNFFTLILIFIILSISIVVGIIATNLVIKPLNRMNSSAADLAQGNWGEELIESSIAEVNDLAVSFNLMGKQFGESFKKREKRIKELKCLHSISKLVEEKIAVDEILQGVADLIPHSWQYPGITCAQIKLEGQSYKSDNFKETEWLLSREITVSRMRVGTVEVYYIEKKPEIDEGPFLKEERNLINAVAERIGQIIEHKQAEESLTKSEERFRGVFDQAAVGVARLTPDGKGVEVNNKLCDIVGYPKDELLTKTFQEITHPDGLQIDLAYVNQLLNDEIKTYSMEKRYYKKSGDVIWINLTVSLMREINNDPDYFIAIIEDITERKQAEKEREQLQSKFQQAVKMQAVGTLAGGIAHEFNNLLGVIMGCADMARDEVPKDSFAKVQLDKVMKASYRVKDLVKQILTFSRQSQQQRISANLCPLVKESVKLIVASIPSSVEIKRDLDAACANTKVDPTEIQQIVMNFCSNAVWAMKEKGLLTITLNEVNLTNHDELILKGPEAGRYVKLSFSDTGCGMDKETVSRIFDPFFTTKEAGDGTGMGLSIVYGIIESYGGTIAVDSEVGIGTTFHLYFPVTDEPATEENVVVEEDPKGTERILFVDDEKIYAEMGEDMISRLGYDVDLKINSKEALDSFKADPNKYDLMITDQIMPHLSGEELVKEMRSIRPKMPIILCTGYSTQMDEKKSKLLGINAFAYKPITKNDIAKLIRKVLDAS